jgi:plasmid stabilization system protein ParE
LKVIVRESAYSDLAQIVRWIAEDSPENARSVAQRLLAAIDEKIALFPRLGRRGRAEGTREWVVSGLPYIIVYCIDEPRDVVTVVGIFHGAQRR